MSKIKIGINGFGRIGKCILRAFYEKKYYQYFDISMINAPSDISIYAHLIKYDSVHGRFNFDVTYDDNYFTINGDKILKSSERNIANINWHDVDFVLECSGKFNNKSDAQQHIKQSVKNVIVSAPCKQADKTIVISVNDHLLNNINSGEVISIGSCTTNCLAPIANILDKNLGIEKGFLTTIHAYTNDQNILDVSHKDLRRARACNLSLIPTSTGAAKAISLVLPHLEGKLDGSAVRAPIANVSMIDLSFIAKKNTNISAVNDIIKQYVIANHEDGIVDYLEEQLVSIDLNHSSYSAIFDPYETKVIGDNFVRVVAWYDNEWAYACRMLDTVKKIVTK
jgi:glyceraldehyde 3-phosphate dehydrogenase